MNGERCIFPQRECCYPFANFERKRRFMLWLIVNPTISLLLNYMGCGPINKTPLVALHWKSMMVNST